MLHYTDISVFNANCRVIVNTVNCAGAMGKGLALEFRLRYPEMFVDYVRRCQRGEVRVGCPYLWECDEISIVNFPTKTHWRNPSKIDWIRRGLAAFPTLPPTHSPIAFPRLGCDLGGLNWADVQPLMEEFLLDLPCESFICLDREVSAGGIEGQMVALINNGVTVWSDGSHLRKDTVEAILSARPFSRFRDMQKIAGIGQQTYERLHRCLYAQVKGVRHPVVPAG